MLGRSRTRAFLSSGSTTSPIGDRRSYRLDFAAPPVGIELVHNWSPFDNHYGGFDRLQWLVAHGWKMITMAGHFLGPRDNEIGRMASLAVALAGFYDYLHLDLANGRGRPYIDGVGSLDSLGRLLIVKRRPEWDEVD